ncbi:MAG: hypothetical protein GY941_06755 [Planctomycetes bacterium]|nr:hypothetical protein [Planctomycetota bacterium]
MNTAKLPDYFTTLNRGKLTLYIHKKYESQLTAQDLNLLFNLYREANGQSSFVRSGEKAGEAIQAQNAGRVESGATYHGRIPCKSIVLESLSCGSFVVRDYWHGGLFGRILRDIFWQGMRPIQELVICECASKMGIRTIEIIAIVKNRVLGPFYRSKLISREIKDSTDLMGLLLRHDRTTFCAQKREAISKVAHAIKDLHDAGIYHADLNLKNILLQTANGGEFVPYIIDLDKSSRFTELKLHSRMKNLMRLDRSLEKFRKDRSHMPCSLYVTKGDKIRFLTEYLLGGRSRLEPATTTRTGWKGVAMNGFDADSIRSRKKFLKTLIDSSVSSYSTHRFWWWLGFGKK